MQVIDNLCKKVLSPDVDIRDKADGTPCGPSDVLEAFKTQYRNLHYAGGKKSTVASGDGGAQALLSFTLSC